MRLLTVIGTRPEAIKMAPVLRALAQRADAVSLLALTGQHRDLVTEPLTWSRLQADFDLALPGSAHDPLDYVATVIPPIKRLLDEVKPDRVIVQGDTASAMAGAAAAAAQGFAVTHVEAGLRTHSDLPWPEEPFRCAIDRLSDQLLAPTPRAALNLRAERLDGEIHVTGNSGIDALLDLLARRPESDGSDGLASLTDSRPMILATLHRRENIGRGANEMCAAVRGIARSGAAQFVIPLHPNPLVAGPVRAALGQVEHVHLIPAQGPAQLVRLMQRCALILTDSGGIQEEAPSFGKPVLVMRDVTERPEGVELGVAQLVGTQRGAIVAGIEAMLRAPPITGVDNPYGDGRAAGRIVSAIFGEPFKPFQAPAVPAPLRPVPA